MVIAKKLSVTTKMNDVNRNRINNYLYRYSIKDNEKNFNKIAEVITKREYFVYWKILCIINNCRVVEEDSVSITVEIDLVEHNHYKKILYTKAKYKESRKKSWACVYYWKSFLNDKDLQWLLKNLLYVELCLN